MKQIPLKYKDKVIGYVEGNKLHFKDKKALEEINKFLNGRHFSLSARGAGIEDIQNKTFKYDESKIIDYSIIVPEGWKPLEGKALEDWKKSMEEGRQREIKMTKELSRDWNKIPEKYKSQRASDMIQSAFVLGYCDDQMKIICEWMIENTKELPGINTIGDIAKRTIKDYYGKEI